METTAEKDLGVLVTCDLTWLKHTIERCAKANKLLGFLRRWNQERKDSSHSLPHCSATSPWLFYQ